MVRSTNEVKKSKKFLSKRTDKEIRILLKEISATIERHKDNMKYACMKNDLIEEMFLRNLISEKDVYAEHTGLSAVRCDILGIKYKGLGTNR